MARSWMTSGMASRGRRLLSAALAIVIGVGFLTSSIVVLQTAVRGMEDAVAAGVRDADLVLSADPAEPLTVESHDAVAEIDGVSSVVGDATVFGELGGGDFVLGAPAGSGGLTLLEGRMPQREGEVLANRMLAEDGFGTGSELDLDVPTQQGDTTRRVSLDVVGVADPGQGNPASYGRSFLTSDATLRDVDPELAYASLQVRLEEGADASAVRDDVGQIAPAALLQTGPEAARDRVDAVTGETAVMAAMLLGFGAVALLTAAIVIANTFTITLAQRTGELALLRCVGATRGQVRRSVLVEAVALGLAASVAGVLAGVGVAAGLLTLARSADLPMPLGSGLALTWVSVVVPVLVGLVVTVLASLLPATRATRVSPLAALRPAGDAVDGTSRVGWLRLALAVALLVGGTGLMVTGALQRQVLLGVAGGLVSFVGVLVAAVVVVPAAVRALGPGAGLAGVPGRLAVTSAVRNPGRAAATSAALLVGVTLITMTSVGAASGQRTALGEIDQEYAVDLVAETVPKSTDDGVQVPTAVPDDLRERLAEVEGVAATVAVDTAYLTIDEGVGPQLAAGLDAGTAGQVLRSEALVGSIEPGIIGLGDTELLTHDVQPGDTLTVTGPGGTADLSVVPLGLGTLLTLHPTDLATLAGDSATEGAVLIRMEERADLAAAMADITDLTDEAGMHVGGAAVMRAQITQVLDVLVLVTTALLGVAVVIAVVGIANTLSLSVIERRREHALLRGMGVTRGQMRVMLALEGVLLAVVSAGLGLVLGVGYAVLGIQTILPEGTPVDLVVPWGRVGIVVGVALLAGVLASVLPARRAARVSPAEGLAAA